MLTPVANGRMSVKHADLRLQFVSSRIPREFQAVVFGMAKADRDSFGKEARKLGAKMNKGTVT